MIKARVRGKIHWKKIIAPTLAAVAAIGISVPVTITIMKKNNGGTTEVQHTITYVDCFEGGSTTTHKKVAHGERTSLYIPEHHDEYGFLGWKTKPNDEEGDYFDFTNQITGDLTLYGYWKTKADDEKYFATEYIRGAGPYVKLSAEYFAQEKPFLDIVVPKQLKNKEGVYETVVGVAPLGFALVEETEGGTIIKHSPIRSISLPNSILAFEDQAFYRCSNLRIINMPTTLTKIGKQSLNGCTKINNITFPTGLVLIGDQAFYGDYNEFAFIENVVLPPTVKYIGDYAFVGCGLESIDMSQCNDVQLGVGVFDSCYYLRNVSLPTKLKGIPNGMFSGCTALKYISIPDDVEYFDENAFYYCTKLNRIIMSDDSKLTWIGPNCFSDCFCLETINFPHHFKSIGNKAFHNAWSLNNVNFSNKNDWTIKYGDQNIDWSHEGQTPYDNAQKIIEYSNKDDDKEIQFLVKPSEDPTYKLKYLTNDKDECVIVGATETTGDQTITIPATIKDDRENEYRVVGIGPSAFAVEDASTNYIQKVEFQKDEHDAHYLRYIGTKAFYNQNSLIKINLDNCSSLENIYDYAFFGCFQADPAEKESTQSIDFSKNPNLEYIGNFAFAGPEDGSSEKSPLTSVILPSSLKTIGMGVFQYLRQLETLDFSGCENLKKITYLFKLLDSEASRWGFYCDPIFIGTKVSTIELSKNNKSTQITFIPEGAFQSPNLKNITLPNKINELGPRALADTGITSITIPQSCRVIGYQTFADCKLTGATFEDTTSSWWYQEGSDTWKPDTDPSKNVDPLTKTYVDKILVKVI